MNINSEIKGKIDNIITKNGEIVILAYSLLEKIESIIEYIISKSLNLKEKSFLFTPIISCIKELTTNAIKANIKNILIKEKVVKDPNDPMSLIEAIKKILHERTMLEYSIKCKKYNLTSRIYLKITNNTKLAKRYSAPISFLKKEYFFSR